MVHVLSNLVNSLQKLLSWKQEGSTISLLCKIKRIMFKFTLSQTLKMELSQRLKLTTNMVLKANFLTILFSYRYASVESRLNWYVHNDIYIFLLNLIHEIQQYEQKESYRTMQEHGKFILIFNATYIKSLKSNMWVLLVKHDKQRVDNSLNQIR